MNILLLSEIIRIISNIFVLYYLPIPLFYKIILIMILDKLDCSHMSFPYTGPLFTKNIDICKTNTYQVSDKVTDTICYIILLFYIISNKIFPKSHINILIYLLIFRIIGTVLFILRNNRNYLFYFPNFFIEITLAFSFLLKHYSLNNSLINIIIPLVVILKIIQEYVMHYNKN